MAGLPHHRLERHRGRRAIVAGAVAGSLALIGFGVDSTIETLSAVVVLWRLQDVSDAREERALQLIAVSFFLLAAYIGVQSVHDLLTGDQPRASIPGIVITGLSLVVMPLLATAKRRVGHRMDSRVVLADAVETWLCAYLSLNRTTLAADAERRGCRRTRHASAQPRTPLERQTS